MWTLKNGKHSFFPAVRTDKTPLLQLGSDDIRWRQFDKSPTAELVIDLCRAARLAQPSLKYAASMSEKQATRMLAWPVTQGDEVQQRLHAFAVGFRAFAASPDHGAAQLLEGLENAATAASDPAFLANLAATVVGKAKKAKDQTLLGPTTEYGSQLLFDFWSDDEPAFSLYAHLVREAVLNALLAGEHAPSKNGKTIVPEHVGVCALRGEPARLLRAPFPEWSAKPVISMPLGPFAKFHESPCNFRYRRADSEAFDIGEDTANAVVGALTTVTEEPMRGKTWRPLKNGARSANGTELSDVLVAYPSCTFDELQNESLPNIADLFGEPEALDDDESVTHRKRFEDTAEPVCTAFNRAIAREPDSSLQILLIRQVSPGQIQIAYSVQPSLAQFNNAVEKWRQSEVNLPDALRVPLPWDKAKQRFSLVKPRLIFPESISRVLSRQWIRNGIDSTAVAPPPVGMVLDLFLRRPGALPTLAAELLNITLSRAEPLLRGVGGALHRDQLHPTCAGSFSQWKAFLNGTVKVKGKPDVGYAAANTISLIGSLLYAMDSIASDYTRRSAFLVGNLLAMMDELHKHYCVVVRDGAIPPALIGNSLLGRAS
ncbi:MAG: hypothetical protein WCK81_15375, partial [Betaproteobacteria bacterium]